MEHATLDLQVMSSSSMLGVEITLKKIKNKNIHSLKKISSATCLQDLAMTPEYNINKTKPLMDLKRLEKKYTHTGHCNMIYNTL